MTKRKPKGRLSLSLAQEAKQRAIARLRQVALERQHVQERFETELERAFDLGLTYGEIGEVVGYHPTRIGQIVRKRREEVEDRRS